MTNQTKTTRNLLRSDAMQRIMAFGALIALFIGFSLIFQHVRLYSLVILAGIAVTAYALLSWQSFVSRETMIAGLRPFVSGQHFMQGIMTNQDDSLSRAQTLFEAIAGTFLNAAQAQLTPLNVFSSIIDTPLVYPPERPWVDIQDKQCEAISAIEYPFILSMTIFAAWNAVL